MAFDYKKEYKEFYFPKGRAGYRHGSQNELSGGTGQRRSECGRW